MQPNYHDKECELYTDQLRERLMSFVGRPWRPTINFRHPANRGLAFSWAAIRTGSTDNFRQVGPSGVSGNPLPVIDAHIGPAVRFASNADDFYTYANRPTFNLPITMAAIIQLNALNTTNGQTFLANTSGANGILFGNAPSTSTINMTARGVANYNPSLAVATGIPYLIVGSIAWDLTVYLMTVRLDNGVTQHDWSGNSGSPITPSGDYRLASNDLLGRSTGGDFATALISNTFMNRDALLQWADDPWGPWRYEEFNPFYLSEGVAAASASSQSAVSIII